MIARRPLTARQVRTLLERQDGKCAVKGCQTVLVVGLRGRRTNFLDEHVQALARGGTNAMKNRALYCVDCAKAKTFHPRSKASSVGSDIFEIAKTRRLRTKARGKMKPSGKWRKGRKMQSRPMPKRRIA